MVATRVKGYLHYATQFGLDLSKDQDRKRCIRESALCCF